MSLEIKEDSTAVLESDATLVAEKTCMSASDVISTHSGKNGCLVFAVRRPGGCEITFVIAKHYTNLVCPFAHLPQDESCAVRKGKRFPNSWQEKTSP